MGEGAEGEDEIQFLRTVSVLLPRVRFAQCGCGWRGRNLPHSTFFYPPHMNGEYWSGNRGRRVMMPWNGPVDSRVLGPDGRRE